MRVTECSDRIEPLLVGHDEQDVRAIRWHFLFRRKPWRNSTLSDCEKRQSTAALQNASA
jgi:hypothetical protein